MSTVNAMFAIPPGLVISGTMVLIGAILCASLAARQLICRVLYGESPESEGEAGMWIFSLTLVTVASTVFIHVLAQM